MVFVKIIYTKHAEEKFIELKRLKWTITKRKILSTLKKPGWTGTSRYGQRTAMSLVDKKHIIRIVFNSEHDIIKVITFHIARKGKYESAL